MPQPGRLGNLSEEWGLSEGGLQEAEVDSWRATSQLQEPLQTWVVLEIQVCELNVESLAHNLSSVPRPCGRRSSWSERQRDLR